MNPQYMWAQAARDGDKGTQTPHFMGFVSRIAARMFTMGLLSRKGDVAPCAKAPIGRLACRPRLMLEYHPDMSNALIPLPPPTAPRWHLTLRAWLAYTASGVMAVALAAPHEHVSPLYLAAGLGLAFALGWGAAMVLPVGLGGFSVVWLAHHLWHSGAPESVVLLQGAISGSGAALQVWMALLLVRRVGQPIDLALDRPADIGRFMLLVGPIACTVNASISVSAMTLLGLMPTSVAPLGWLRWWASDTMGVLIGAPMVLTLIGHPRVLWQTRRHVVGIPLVLVSVLMSLGLRQAYLWRVEHGAESWMLASVGVALSASLTALLLVMTGHTRRIEAAMEEASKQRAAAEDANRAKSEFLSRMSHELRTPLNAVLGFAQVMELDPIAPLPTSQQQRVKQIQQAGWHLLDMIDDVLDIARIDTGTLRLQVQALPVRQELDATLSLFQEQALRKQVRLIGPDHVEAHWGVMADSTRLRQVLSNLISNAIKYNQPGGSVRLEVQRARAGQPGSGMQIAIHDDGLGMSAAQLEQLFQPFNRLGRERKVPDGAGIGLVISRHLAALMGGQLEAQSRIGSGSTLTLTLPDTVIHINRHADASITRLSTANIVDHTERHLLYVEDNRANSDVVVSALAAAPWIRVSVAATIEAGLNLLRNRAHAALPDMVLLDVHLPDASGQDFLKLIKANPETAHIPVIMVSADAMPEQIDMALSAGAFCYLTKPLQVPELMRQINAALSRG